MVKYKAKYITSEIKHSCYEDNLFKSDFLFDCGETKIVQVDATYFFKKSDIFLIPKNQLATIINYPKDVQPNKTVVMHLSKEGMIDYYSRLDVKAKSFGIAENSLAQQSPLVGKLSFFADSLFRNGGPS